MSGATKLKLAGTVPGKGATAEASAIEMERRIIALRWLMIMLASGTLPFLSRTLGGQTIPLLALIVVGGFYNLFLQLIVVRRRPQWLTRGYITTIGDVLLVTGGIKSPFFLAYFVATVTAATRFGGVVAMIAVGTITLSYSGVVAYIDSLNGLLLSEQLTDLALRTGFVAVTGIFVGFVGDRARKAERALQEELERAHAALSEVTVELNRDLDFEQTCQLTADKGRALLKADAALLQVQMPNLIGQDESVPPATSLYLSWSEELKAAHAGADLSTARIALGPAISEQVVAVSDPN